jgi:hypothetical protein
VVRFNSGSYDYNKPSTASLRAATTERPVMAFEGFHQ